MFFLVSKMYKHHIESIFQMFLKSFCCCLIFALYILCFFSFTGSVTDGPPGPPNSGRKGELRSAVSLCVHVCECSYLNERDRKRVQNVF